MPALMMRTLGDKFRSRWPSWCPVSHVGQQLELRYVSVNEERLQQTVVRSF